MYAQQVFRRRQQDLDKLSVEQIERSRKELSDLERKFLERVAQTNRTRSGKVLFTQLNCYILIS